MDTEPPEEDHEKIAQRVRLLAGCACLNSVSLGFQVGAVSAAVPLIQDTFNLNSFQLEVYEALLSASAIFGTVVAALVSEPVGRLRAFQIAALFFIVGSLLQAFAMNYEMMCVGICVVGSGVGFGLSVDPIYIAEISPAGGRGYFVTWSEIAIAGGQTLGFAAGLVVESVLSGWTGSWRVIIGCGILTPCALLVAVAFVMPESPRWLAIHGREGDARAVLRGLGLRDETVERTLGAISDEHSVEEGSLWELLASRRELKPAVRLILIVGIGAAVAQQINGCDAVFFNFLFALEATGISTVWVAYGVLLGLGVVKLLTAVLCSHLLDSVGRRPLILTSAFGVAAALFVLAIEYAFCVPLRDNVAYQVLVVATFYCYIFLFELGLGPGCWLVPSEVFYNQIRMRAMTLATFANRMTTTGAVVTAISIQDAWSWSGFFSWYASMATCAAVFLYVYLPETKGKSLEAMYKYFEEITESDLTKPFTPSPTRAVLADRTAGATVRESDNKIV